MGRPEIGFRKGSCSQSILVGDQHKFIIREIPQLMEVSKDARYKLQLFQRIQLVIIVRLFDQSAVTIDKNDSFLHRSGIILFIRIVGKGIHKQAVLLVGTHGDPETTFAERDR